MEYRQVGSAVRPRDAHEAVDADPAEVIDDRSAAGEGLGYGITIK